MADESIPLPFKVGQKAESRCFTVGYRGAWFRCKIKRIDWKNGYLRHAVEYYDFTDEKIKWIKVYQKNPWGVKDNKSHLMLRPPFPQFFKESQLPEINAISEVVVVVNDFWKEGDLVDWWTDDCFWSGRVSQLFRNRKVKIELLPQPLGEGQFYEALCDDLRPSLDWCPRDGWIVPTPEKPENFPPCARIIRPVGRESAADLLRSTVDPVDEGTKAVHGNERPQAKESLEERPLSAATSKEDLYAPESHTDLDAADTEAIRISCSHSVSCSHVRDAPDAKADAAVENDVHSTSERLGTTGSTYLRCMHSDTLEALAMDWEEMLCKVKWLKAIMKFGIPPPTPTWEFVEHHPPSARK